MTLTTFPDQPRRTLASQLDRLEGILNNLHATLHSAVSAAVEKAVSQAVQQALPALVTALFTSPQFLNALRSHAAPAATPTMPACALVRDACRRLGQISRSACRQARIIGASWLDRAIQHSPTLAAVIMKRLFRSKRRVLGACGVGLVVSLVISCAGPWLGVLLGFVLGFLLTLAVQDRHRLLPLLTTQIAEE